MSHTKEAPSPRDMMHLLIATMREHKRIFDSMRERTGLGRTAHRMLMILFDNPSGCSQTKLAEVLEISTAAVAVALKKMEADGYVTRTVCPDDSRLNTTLLTEKGRSVVAEARSAFNEIDNAVFDGFSKDEMQALCSYTLRLQDNMRKYESGKDDAE